MSSLGTVVIFALAVAVEAAPHQGQPEFPSVGAWFDAAWDEAQGLPDLEDHSIAWRVETWDLPSPAEIARLRDQVSGRPDHPGRHTLERVERCNAGDPPIIRYQLWSRGDGAWRIAESYEGGGYLDGALNGQSAWQMTPRRLDRGSDAAFAGDSMASLRSTLYTFWPQVSRLYFGGLSDGAISEIQRSECVERDDGSWSVDLWWGESIGSADYVAEVSGTWDSRTGLGRIESERIRINSAHPASVGSGAEYLDWEYVPELSRWIAGRVEERRADDELERVIVFEGVKLGQPGEFERATAMPRANRADLVRGQPTFVQVVDHRPSARTGTSSGSTDGGADAVVPDNRSHSIGRIWRRWLGWIVAGSIVVGLLLLRLHRKQTV